MEKLKFDCVCDEEGPIEGEELERAIIENRVSVYLQGIGYILLTEDDFTYFRNGCSYLIKGITT